MDLKLLFECSLYLEVRNSWIVCTLHSRLDLVLLPAALAENGRLNKVNSIFGAFSKIMSAHRGEVLCTVTTAKVAHKLLSLSFFCSLFLWIIVCSCTVLYYFKTSNSDQIMQFSPKKRTKSK